MLLPYSNSLLQRLLSPSQGKPRWTSFITVCFVMFQHPEPPVAVGAAWHWEQSSAQEDTVPNKNGLKCSLKRLLCVLSAV